MFMNSVHVLFIDKKFGYVKYADAACASHAMETLNGEVVYGNRLKVLPADPPRSDGREVDDGDRAGSREKRSHDDDHGVYRGKFSRHE